MLSKVFTALTLANLAVAQVDGSKKNGSGLIEDALAALGGREALAALSGVTWQDDVFKSTGMMQSYNILTTDRYIVANGAQNVSLSFSESETLAQRIDRNLQRSEFYTVSGPRLPPQSFSLTMRSGSDGYACYLKGNSFINVPTDTTTGYVDSALTEYLLFQAMKASPRLLLEVEEHDTTEVTVDLNGIEHPAIRDNDLNLVIILDPNTRLPHRIRSFEDHAIFGKKTPSDLLLRNYTDVSGLQLPLHRMVLYRGDSLTEEAIASNIIVNPPFADDFFDGLGADLTTTVPAPPASVPGFSFAEIGEFWSNMIWTGPVLHPYENIITEKPADDLPNAHVFTIVNSTYRQMVLEFEHGVIAVDAPVHQSELLIQWVNETLGKPITHIFPTHHHHDHSFAVDKFVDIGAKIITPKVAAPFYKLIKGAKLVTFDHKKPYVHSDGQMQARFLWDPNAVHAVDLSYVMVTTKCPSENSSMLVFTSDMGPFHRNQQRSWVDNVLAHGMSRNTTHVAAHFPPSSLATLIDELGYEYPSLTPVDFKTGGDICLD